MEELNQLLEIRDKMIKEITFFMINKNISLARISRTNKISINTLKKLIKGETEKSEKLAEILEYCREYKA